ncbi:hypothetical protein [Calditerricola satsumensis]|uniref:Uncharacterized protein n=1 Tax=Calditerricola satsumensis TaxID=373054 RepID=A0A8J3B390_9BACI|nr:hypothetical protein [Calditerricola satsumensis]GGJ92596.1 hypothetical protein GCM10007043_02820 [Calditerricola satsumensis]
MSMLNKIEYALKSAAKETWGDYGYKDLAKDVTMPKAEAYSKAVKTGLISAGKTGTFIAKRFIPVVSTYFLVEDLYKFTKGFIKGWHAYGR